MPKLTAISFDSRREELADAIVETKGNKVQAVKKVYPNQSLKSVRTNANKILNRYGAIERAVEICESMKETKLKNLLQSFTKDLNAKKPLVLSKDSHIEYVDDIPTQLKAKTFLLSTVHGINDSKNPNVDISIDNRSINLSNDNPSVSKLSDVISKLSNLNDKIVSNLNISKPSIPLENKTLIDSDDGKQ